MHWYVRLERFNKAENKRNTELHFDQLHCTFTVTVIEVGSAHWQGTWDKRVQADNRPLCVHCQRLQRLLLLLHSIHCQQLIGEENEERWERREKQVPCDDDDDDYGNGMAAANERAAAAAVSVSQVQRTWERREEKETTAVSERKERKMVITSVSSASNFTIDPRQEKRLW